MIKQIIWIALRILILLLSGLVFAVLGFGAVVNLGFMIAPEFALHGKEGYEATGPIGFVLGALIGLSTTSVLLFRKPVTN